MYFFVYHQNSLCRRCLIICFIVKETEAKRGCKTCLRHMASECGDWIEGQAVLASAAEISCERPGRPLNIQIKPRRNMNAPIQALWCIKAENREKHQEVRLFACCPTFSQPHSGPSHHCLLQLSPAFKPSRVQQPEQPERVFSQIKSCYSPALISPMVCTVIRIQGKIHSMACKTLPGLALLTFPASSLPLLLNTLYIYLPSFHLTSTQLCYDKQTAY